MARELWRLECESIRQYLLKENRPGLRCLARRIRCYDFTFIVKTAADRRPSKKWSIALLGKAGAAAVVFSYLLSLTLAVACVALPYVVFVLLPIPIESFLLIRILLSAFGLVAGLTILWSLIPRRNKFQISGVPIDISRESVLAVEIESIAAALNESMPAEVYLVTEANAFVVERREWWGLRSRKILALGLPLLPLLTVAEFRALLAHEFSHFYSGDTRLAPWVFRARLAMIRVFQNLGEKSNALSILTRYIVVAVPYMMLMGGFRLFWTLFMRLTQLISRYQEFRSDELACYVAGSETFAEALRKVHTSSSVFKAYWQNIVFPVVSHGYQPQIADGFIQFMAAPQNAQAAAKSLEDQILVQRSKPFDSHPPLAAGLARIQAISIASPQIDDRSAVALFRDLGALEGDLLKKLMPAIEKSPLNPVDWEAVGAQIYIPRWRQQVAPFLPLLSQKTIASLPDCLAHSGAIADKILNPPGLLLNRAQREDRASEILACAVTLSLVDNGWSLHANPGSVYVQRDTLVLEPQDILNQLQSGRLSANDWEVYCTKAGIGGWLLAN